MPPKCCITQAFACGAGASGRWHSLCVYTHRGTSARQGSLRKGRERRRYTLLTAIYKTLVPDVCTARNGDN